MRPAGASAMSRMSTIADICFEDRDDLIVGFIAVDHAQPPIGTARTIKSPSAAGELGEHANVQRIAVTANGFTSDP